ncbi:hypothetical protein D3C83_86660 [compost metagenome]
MLNAFVEATPISTPARVRKCSFVSRIIALVATLQIASVRSWPSERACLSAASVSAVSPDWEMTTTSVLALGTLSRYRYSLAISTCVGRRASDSIQYFAVSPA